MKRELIIAIILSGAIHVGLLLFFAYPRSGSELPLGTENAVMVEVGSGGEKSGSSQPVQTQSTGTYEATSEAKGDGKAGSGQKEEEGIFGSPNGNPILAKIRTKIERSKYYPPEAKREGIVGSTKIKFELNEDGSIKRSEIITSSGNLQLDSAALVTLNRATPLPYYSGEISLVIKYSLASR